MPSPAVIQVAGLEFRTGDGVLLSATVSLTEGKSRSTCSVRLADPRMELAAAFPLPTEDAAVPVRAFAGGKAFEGVLTKIQHRQGRDMPGVLSITASDSFSGARKSSRSSVIADASAAQQIKILAQRSGHDVFFRGDSEDQLDEIQYGQRVQRGVSDAAMIREILDALGHTYVVREDKTLEVYAIGSADDGEIKTLTLGDSGTIESLTFDVKELDRSTTPNVYSQAGNKTFEQDLSLDPTVLERAVRLERTGVLFNARDLPSFTDQTLERAKEAQGRAEKLFSASVVLTDVDLDIQVGGQVLLRGVTGRFSGVWNVEGVTHALAPLRRTTLKLYNGGGDDPGGRIQFLGDTILFDFDVDTVGDAYLQVLDRVAQRLLLYDETETEIVGHADEVGSDAYNLDLGLRRASSVRAGLIERGVPASRLSVSSQGESNPVSSTAALNRRVTFVTR